MVLPKKKLKLTNSFASLIYFNASLSVQVGIVFALLLSYERSKRFLFPSLNKTLRNMIG
jgi:hypothetical protein